MSLELLELEIRHLKEQVQELKKDKLTLREELKEEIKEDSVRQEKIIEEQKIEIKKSDELIRAAMKQISDFQNAFSKAQGKNNVYERIGLAIIMLLIGYAVNSMFK